MDIKLEYLTKTVYRSPVFSQLLFELNKDRYLAKNKHANPRVIQDDVSRYHNTAFPPAELRRQELMSQQPGNAGNSPSGTSDEALGSSETRKKSDQASSSYSYKSQYKPYGAKAFIDILGQRTKLFYRILGDYFTRLKENLQPKSLSKEHYNSPESPIRINNLRSSKYLPFIVYEIVKPKGYEVKKPEYKTRESLESKDEENRDYENLEDILKAA